ncbi:hypothetical protein EYF80_036027 [Liparis tanakae]|uniref:Uncharacterized protein n=1 Tax=Liparis tanakae TaxID=230148 RepID=A0A4Z2GKJ7_9TELE|nr:hypothetical protein EYF80_036027 [Liparis tanakae]
MAATHSCSENEKIKSCDGYTAALNEFNKRGAKAEKHLHRLTLTSFSSSSSSHSHLLQLLFIFSLKLAADKVEKVKKVDRHPDRSISKRPFKEALERSAV